MCAELPCLVTPSHLSGAYSHFPRPLVVEVGLTRFFKANSYACQLHEGRGFRLSGSLPKIVVGQLTNRRQQLHPESANHPVEKFISLSLLFVSHRYCGIHRLDRVLLLCSGDLKSSRGSKVGTEVQSPPKVRSLPAHPQDRLA